MRRNLMLTTDINLPQKMEIKNQSFDGERALYNLRDADVLDCTFADLADGESVLKEIRAVNVINCQFALRYPLWHAEKFSLIGSELEDTDLAFEYSDVKADIKGHVESIKNPKTGTIIIDSVGEIIRDDRFMEPKGEIQIRR